MLEAPAAPAPRVLFLDDDEGVLTAAELLLGCHGIEVETASAPEAAEQRLKAERFDALLLDLNFQRGERSGEAGLTFLARQVARDPATPIVVVTGHSGVNIAVAAMRLGATDFVMKPWNNARFVETVQAALKTPISLAAAPPLGQDLNLERTELQLIKQALNRRQHNISQAAKDLGLTRAALYRRMEKHGL